MAGIRYVIFTQGCLLRCQYCHNADTWEIGKGKEITVEEVMQDVTCYLPFIEASGGGITVSGGEPLLQLDFLIELFKSVKRLVSIQQSILLVVVILRNQNSKIS